MMNPKDWFMASINRRPVDRVSRFDFLFQLPLYTEMRGRTPVSYNARDAMDVTAALGLMVGLILAIPATGKNKPQKINIPVPKLVCINH
jgi:hypothetical protein